MDKLTIEFKSHSVSVFSFCQKIKLLNLHRLFKFRPQTDISLFLDKKPENDILASQNRPESDNSSLEKDFTIREFLSKGFLLKPDVNHSLF